MAQQRKKQLTASLERYWLVTFWGVMLIGGIIALYHLFNKLPFETHDNNYEIWLYAFDQLIKAGKFFPDWSKDLSLQHGNPLFIFYPPLFFYLAELPRILGAGLVVAIKLAVGASVLGAFFTMYLFARELLGKWGGLWAGLIYLLTPYHLALVYIRGAYSENLSYALLPLLLFFIYRTFAKPTWQAVLGLAGISAALVLTNLPFLLVTAVSVAVLIIGLAITNKKIPLIPLVAGALGGLGLSAFYWLPMITYAPLVQIEKFIGESYYFADSFITFIQLLNPLQWRQDEFTQLGIMSVAVVTLYLWRNHSLDSGQKRSIIPLLWVGIVAIFMMMRISHWLWSGFPVLAYVQFPFRFLSVVFIVIAILGGVALMLANTWIRYACVVGLLLQSVWLANPTNGYRHPVYLNDASYTTIGDIKAYLMTLPPEEKDITLEMHTADMGFLPKGVDKEKLKSLVIPVIYPAIHDWNLRQAANYTPPIEQKIILPQSAEMMNVQETIDSMKFDVTMPQSGPIEYRQFNFPGWIARVDGREQVASGLWLGLNIPAGQHSVEFQFTAVPGALTARIITLLTLLIMLVIGVLVKIGALKEIFGDLPWKRWWNHLTSA